MKRQLKINALVIFLSGFLCFLQTAGAIAAPGDLDTTFGGTGKMRVGVGGGNDEANAVARQSDGKLVVAGKSSEFLLMRYNTNGTLDTSFGIGGKVVVDVSGGNDSANAIALDSAGRAVVVGQANGLFGLVRLLGNAAPTAATVSVSGRVLTPAGRGLANAVVSMTDMQGNTRAARTTTFGYFRFEEVEAGRTYIFEVRSKRYRFAPQVVTITEDFDELNFTAEP